jgi:hypothetical protein
MDARDLVVTPIFILLIYGVAYAARPFFCDQENYRYFFPALTVKLVGALALGLLYTFYYRGGDTFNFHTIGSRIMWEAFWDSPGKWLDMFFANGQHRGDYFQYSRQIYFFSDKPSFFIVRLAAFFDLLTMSSYAATACLFSVIGFAGGWALFLTFYRRYPELKGWVAFATLFIPSVIFWGSGLLKDTITLACLGFIVFTVDKVFIQKRYAVSYILLLIASVYAVFIVRKFMLQAFIPAAFLWIYYSRLISIKSLAARLVVFPMVLVLIVTLGYYSFVKIGEGDVRYDVSRLAETARTTAYDIAFYSGRGAGSFYSLGELDGTLGGMMRLAPAAINVSLYRPYLWEVRNPLMAISALESFVFLVLTVYIILLRREQFLLALRNEDVVFMLTFALVFAFATGISSYNFGTLSRYKIALLPFFTMALIIIFYSKRKEEALPEEH